MFLCYVDETGNRDPRLEIPRKDGTVLPGDPLYVLTAVTLFEQRWHGFEKTLNRHKSMLMDLIYKSKGIRLQLADCEVKSNWLRMPRERQRHPFLGHLTDRELQGLVDLYYQQLDYHKMNVFSVIMDKRCLPDYMDQEKLHRKSWELLLELVERFMRARHGRHQAIMITDDVSKQMNRSLAMKHAHILDQGTRRDLWLRHICEMPMFVRSELSNGVQLADLCSYNIYRALKTADLTYAFFQRIADRIWSRHAPARAPAFSGIYIYTGQSAIMPVWEQFEKERADRFTPASPDV